jgi:tyrosine-protein kinase Etk/Wzc
MVNLAPDDRRNHSTLRAVNAHAGDTQAAAGLRSSRAHLAIGDVLEILAQKAAFILGCGIAAALLVLLVTCLSRMEFSSSGRLYLGEMGGKHESRGNNPELALSGQEQGDIANEMEILRSRSNIIKAVLASGLNVTIAPTGSTAPRYWQWRMSGRDPGLLEQGTQDLQAVQTQLAPHLTLAQRYQVALLGADAYQVSAAGTVLGSCVLGRPCQLPNLSLMLVRGQGVELHTGASYDVTVAPIASTVRSAIDTMLVTSPRAVANNELVKVLSVDFAHTSPRMAATFVQAVMESYLDARRSWYNQSASADETFVTNQLEVLRKSLDENEKKLSEYRRSNGVLRVDSEAAELVDQLGRYEEKRSEAQLLVSAFEEVQRALRQPNPPVEAFLLGEAYDSVLGDLAKSLAAAQRELTDTSTRFGERSPELIAAKAKVNAQLASVRNYVTSKLERARDNLNSITQLITKHEQRMNAVPGAEVGLARLTRETEVYSQMYSSLLERQQQATITKASTVSKNRILDAPEVSYIESAPRLMVRLGGSLIGILLAAIFVLVRRLFAPTLQSESDAIAASGSLPVFARVPAHPAPAEVSFELDAGPVSRLDLKFADAFRTLRTRLYRASGEHGGSVILVTSPTPRSGTTTCVHALAFSLAADEKRLLLVDLAHPYASQAQQAERERYDSGASLRSSQSMQVELRGAIETIPTPQGRFDLIRCSSIAGANILSGGRLKRFVAEMRPRYDYVLFDARSYPEAPDALSIALQADSVLSVMRLRVTPRALAQEHFSGLARSAPVHAIVLFDEEAGQPVRDARRAQRGYDARARGSFFDRLWSAGPRGWLLTCVSAILVGGLLAALRSVAFEKSRAAEPTPTLAAERGAPEASLAQPTAAANARATTNTAARPDEEAARLVAAPTPAQAPVSAAASPAVAPAAAAPAAAAPAAAAPAAPAPSAAAPGRAAAVERPSPTARAVPSSPPPPVRAAAKKLSRPRPSGPATSRAAAAVAPDPGSAEPEASPGGPPSNPY